MPMICKITRGNLLESAHIIYGVAIDEDGNQIAVSGNPDYVTCIRSAFKPFQAATSLKAGAVDVAGFTESELALMCASHSGDDIHVKTAQSMISKLGYNLLHYECGSHAPYDRNSRYELIKTNAEHTPFHNNCSGKHAGMLALAKHLGVDPRDYTKPDHLVQQKILELAKDYTNMDEIPFGIDGCSAVAPFFSLSTIANLFLDLVKAEKPELNRIYNAMTNNPYLIGGNDRFDTDFIRALSGRAISKVGGEAVQGVGIKTKKYGNVGIALKVLDGSMRCLPLAILSMLNKLELLTEQENRDLQKWTNTKMYNHRQIHTGNMKIVWE